MRISEEQLELPLSPKEIADKVYGTLNNTDEQTDMSKYLFDKGELVLDSIGRPVFKDSITWETNTPELYATWNCIKALLDEQLVPYTEVDGCIELMEKLSSLEDTKAFGNYDVTLPVNYFTGMWHCVNSTRKFHLFKNDKPLDKSIDGLAMKYARLLDMYHSVKKDERMKDIMEASPEVVATLQHSKTPTII